MYQGFSPLAFMFALARRVLRQDAAGPPAGSSVANKSTGPSYSYPDRNAEDENLGDRMKTAGRFKRTAGAMGLMAVVVLVASGCELLPGAQPKFPIKNYQFAGVELTEEFKAAYGDDRKLAEPIVDAATDVLAVKYDQFPQYTVHGFVPTDENFQATVEALRPLVTEESIKESEADWAKDKSLPVQQSYRPELNSEGVHGYTFTAPSGEKCTDSDTPRTYEPGLLSISAKDDKTPVVNSNVGVNIHCQEGYRMNINITDKLEMVQKDGKWIMRKNDGELNKEFGVQVIK